MNPIRCPGAAQRGVPDHDAEPVAVRLHVPLDAALKVRAVAVYRCGCFGCPLRLEAIEEPAHDVQGALDEALARHGLTRQDDTVKHAIQAQNGMVHHAIRATRDARADGEHLWQTRDQNHT